MSIASCPRRLGAATAVLLLATASPSCSRSSGGGGSAPATEALSGRVYVTDQDGAAATDDVFALACDVYLSAGQLEEADDDPGVPAGDYYLQVTDAAGTVLLSRPGPDNGVLTVAGDDAEVPRGTFLAYEGDLVTAASADAGLRVRLCPLEGASGDDAYAVWLTPVDAYDPDLGLFGFRPDHSLVTTYALSGPAALTADLVIRRFCDSDADGSSEGEALQDGVRYMVSISTVDDGAPFEVRTGALVAGEARVTGVPAPAQVSVCELVPGTGVPGTWWYGTAPGFGSTAGAPGGACSLVVTDGGTVTLEFGAACVAQSTDGWRTNDVTGAAGKALLQANDPAWRQLLDAAPLVDADGAPFVLPAGSFYAAHAALTTWLTSSGSTNEAHLLSRELALALLAQQYGSLDVTSEHVLRPAGASCWGANTATAAALVARAQELLAADGFTPPGDPNAPEQLCVRDALAGVNTNASPVLTGTCCTPYYP